MGVRYAMRGTGLFARYYAALRNNSLVFLLVIFTIMLAMYVSIFYIFATGTALNSLQNLGDDANSNLLDDMTKAKLQSEIPADDAATPAQVSPQKDENQANANNRRSQRVIVNDQVIPVPKNGSSHTVIRNSSGGGDVDVSITSSSTGESNTSSTMEVNVESSSTTTKEVE